MTDSPTGGKHYWTFDIDEAQAKQEETRNLYEYPNHTDVVLPFMDLDKYDSENPERWDDPDWQAERRTYWVTTIVGLFIEQFKELVGISLTWKNLAIAYGSRRKGDRWKHSFHVVVLHPDCAVRDLRRLRGLMYRVWVGLGHDATAFDRGIYTSKRQWRMCYSKKISKSKTGVVIAPALLPVCPNTGDVIFGGTFDADIWEANSILSFFEPGKLDACVDRFRDPGAAAVVRTQPDAIPRKRPAVSPVERQPKRARQRSTMREIRSVVSRIPIKRFEDYADWCSIGMAIHFETGGDDAGLDMWIEYSRKVPAYADSARGEYTGKWASFSEAKQLPVTMGTLKKWAAADVVRGSLVEIAEVLLAGLYSKAIVWCQDQLFFKGDNGWFTNEKTVRRLLFHAITQMDLKVSTPQPAPLPPKLTCVRTSNKRIKELVVQMPEQNNESHHSTMRSMHKLPSTNRKHCNMFDASDLKTLLCLMCMALNCKTQIAQFIIIMQAGIAS